MGITATRNTIIGKINLKYKTEILWIDQNIDDEKNTKYIKELKKGLNLENFETYKDVSNAIEKMKNLSFVPIVIICSGEIYPELIKLFKQNINEFKICPKIIIFTENKKTYLDLNLNDEELHINHKFYNIGGVVDNFNEVKNFILKYLINESYNIKIFQRNNHNIFNFEYINYQNQLILPIIFSNNISIEKEKIKKFNEMTYMKYKRYEIGPLYKILFEADEIPYEILSKFWMRSNLLNSYFSIEMEKNLLSNKSEDYLIFIQMMYEGIKLNSFSFKSETELYLGSYFNDDTIKKLEYSFKNKDINSNLPVSIIYSTSFFSFYGNKEKAENSKNNVLLILNNVNIDSSIGCASIKQFSLNENEEEVLVFPFACFEIKSLKKKNGANDYEVYYEVYLDFIGNYKNLFEGKTNEELIKDIPNDSYFVKNICNTNILDNNIQEQLKKIINSKNLKKLRQSEIKEDMKSEKLSDSDSEKEDQKIKNVKSGQGIKNSTNIDVRRINFGRGDKFDFKDIIENKVKTFNDDKNGEI